jgi:hypothetical protein
MEGVTEATDLGSIGVLTMLAWQVVRLVNKAQQFLDEATRHRHDIAHKLDQLILAVRGRGRPYPTGEQEAVPERIEIDRTPLHEVSRGGTERF